MTTRIKHLYVHVPFCNAICFYCDFAHQVYKNDLVDKWLNKLSQEIHNECKDLYETIYIGGGTPSCLSCDQLEKLLKLISPFSKNFLEYTVEVNPESIDIDKIKLLKQYGVNRISMGIQSSDDNILKSLNRHHSFADARNKIRLLQDNGFNNISVDLMYSLPGQSIEILQKSLEDICDLNVPHISIYSLTIEENTVFGKKGYKPLDEDTEADMYDLIRSYLKEKGYINYEVSNFAKRGYESKHNLAYWNYEDFLGVSVGASSKIGNRRYTNTRILNKYLENISNKDEDLILDKDDLKFEHIMMSLRTIYGLDIINFNNLYKTDFIDEYKDIIEGNKLLEIRNDHLICKDLALLNSVLLGFLP